MHRRDRRFQIGVFRLVKMFISLVKFCQQVKMSDEIAFCPVINLRLCLEILPCKGVPVAMPQRLDCFYQFLFRIIHANILAVFDERMGRADRVLRFLHRSQSIQLDPNIEIHLSPVFLPEFLKFFSILAKFLIVHAKSRLKHRKISVS